MEEKMNKMSFAPVPLLLLALMGAGCSTHPTKQQIGTASGAVVGRVASV